MIDRRAVQVGALVWAMVGFAVATGSLTAVNADALVPLAIASVAFPACAAAAALALGRDHTRIAGVLLLLSVATPTYFAWAINLPALVIGVALAVAPGRILRSSPAGLSPV